jgi:predicted ATPase/DNA-binding XRE family transcriptional regulator
VGSSTDRRSFGALLKQQRLAAGLTQAALGERAGIAERTIQDLERDVARPRRETVQRLIEALELAPADRAVFEAVSPSPRQRSGAAMQASVPSGAPDRSQGHLPVPATALLGRERELMEIDALIQAGARLVTLTGPGGVGKTRLALQVAASILAAGRPVFEHGAFLIDLAPITDAALVPVTIAHVLGLRDLNGRPVLEGLKEHLRDRSILLVLDNVEQIQSSAPIVAELLAASPHLSVLATSRETLRVRGEHEYQLRPLELPDVYHVTSANALAGNPAVALFVERARAIRADFALTPESVSTIAAICARLEGLPLAIELAAARTRLLSPLAILGRLEHRLPVLTGGSRDLPARQQTLRDAIAWSYGLLSEAERRLLRRLAVFVGGWSLEAAEAVCDGGARGEGRGASEMSHAPLAPRPSPLDVLELLAAKSLVQRGDDVDGEPRFDMLETIREYALERLDESGEASIVRRRHAEYFVALAERTRPALQRAGRPSWLRRLKVEHDNFHAALRWIVEQGEADLGLRLGGSLSHFWDQRGYHEDGHTLVDAVPWPPMADADPPGLSLQVGGRGRSHRGDGDRVQRWLRVEDHDGSVGMAVLAVGAGTARW